MQHLPNSRIKALTSNSSCHVCEVWLTKASIEWGDYQGVQEEMEY